MDSFRRGSISRIVITEGELAPYMAGFCHQQSVVSARSFTRTSSQLFLLKVDVACPLRIDQYFSALLRCCTAKGTLSY